MWISQNDKTAINIRLTAFGRNKQENLLGNPPWCCLYSPPDASIYALPASSSHRIQAHDAFEITIELLALAYECRVGSGDSLAGQ